MNIAKSPSSRIPSLDGLRGIAILLVVSIHLAGSRYYLPASFFNYLGDLGALGVRVFFVISGFLITTLLLREQRSTGNISLPLFYIRRTFRLFPAFYVFLLVIALLSFIKVITLAHGDLFHAATFTINYHWDRSWWVGHVWSLSIEEQFYLLWPAVLAFAGFSRSMRAARVVLLLCPLVRVVLMTMYPGRHAWMGELFPTVADSLATGCLLAGFRDQLIQRSWYMTLLASRWFNVLPICACGLNLFPGGRLRVLLLETVLNVCIAITIDRNVRMPMTISGRFLNGSALRYVGVRSYSIYLWQQLFLRHANAVLPFPGNLALALGTAWLSYRFVELPFFDLRRRLEGNIKRRSLLAVDGEAVRVQASAEFAPESESAATS